MEKNITIVKNCIAEILNGIPHIIVALGIFSVIPDETPPLVFFPVMIVVPLILLFIRLQVHYLWLFNLLHIALPFVIIFIFIGESAWQIIFGLSALIQVVISYTVKVAANSRAAHLAISTAISENECTAIGEGLPNEGEIPTNESLIDFPIDYGSDAVAPMVTVAFAAIFYLLTGVSGLIFLLMISIALYFFYHYLTHYLVYNDMCRRTTGTVPSKDIFAADLSLVGGFTLITVILMALFAGREIMVGIGAWFLEWLRRFLTWLFALGNKGSQEMEVQELTLVEEAVEIGEMLPEIEMANRPFLVIVEAMVVILSIAVTAVIIVALVFTMVKLIKFAFGLRLRWVKTAEVEAEKDIVEKLRWQKRETRREKRKLFRSADEKVRRIFSDTICKRRIKWEKIHNNTCYFTAKDSTAREMSALFPEAKEEVEILVSLYEKARYAANTCTAADVRTARSISTSLLARAITDTES
ncbi:MAG: DUF4129 domain-containing protein [Lachnospiraceae bacterium]|jgi:hypothetical protein|nr:DUF4129 domain-containing protein [Lachnospiraceae bacterium]